MEESAVRGPYWTGIAAFAVSLVAAAVMQVWAVAGLVLVIGVSVTLSSVAWGLVRNHSPFKKWGELASLVLPIGIISALVTAQIGDKYLPRTVDVSPRQASLNSFVEPSRVNLPGKIDITALNRGDEPVYQVWLKLDIKSLTIIPPAIELEFPSLEQRILNGEDALSVVQDSQCYIGHNAKVTMIGFICSIARLNPAERFTIRLISSPRLVKKQLDPNINHGQIIASIAQFRREPGTASQTRSERFPFATYATSDPIDGEDFKDYGMIMFCPGGPNWWAHGPGMTCSPKVWTKAIPRSQVDLDVERLLASTKQQVERINNPALDFAFKTTLKKTGREIRIWRGSKSSNTLSVEHDLVLSEAISKRYFSLSETMRQQVYEKIGRIDKDTIIGVKSSNPLKFNISTQLNVQELSEVRLVTTMNRVDSVAKKAAGEFKALRD